MTIRLTPADILGSDGRIARRLEHYESRPQQMEMADAVARAIAGRRHLLVEAGTGVGKSFAYLVPAILAAVGSQNHRADAERAASDEPAKQGPAASASNLGQGSDQDFDLDRINAELSGQGHEPGEEQAKRDLAKDRRS